MKRKVLLTIWLVMFQVLLLGLIFGCRESESGEDGSVGSSMNNPYQVALVQTGDIIIDGDQSDWANIEKMATEYDDGQWAIAVCMQEFYIMGKKAEWDGRFATFINQINDKEEAIEKMKEAALISAGNGAIVGEASMSLDVVPAGYGEIFSIEVVYESPDGVTQSFGPIWAQMPPQEETPMYSYEIIAEYPHDPYAFTQGLVFHDGYLFESIGLWGFSSIRKVELTTGTVLQQRDMDDQYYGEGLTIFDERIIQLTWKSGQGFVYDSETFVLLEQFSYVTDGWGLTHDGARLIMSDGSATLRILDPNTFEPVSSIAVFDDTGPVSQLNELEFVNGEVLASVWQTDTIARINPATGQVTSWIDLSGILESYQDVDVLNGIAFDKEKGRLFITGKLWPSVFEIDLIPRCKSTSD